ncbi:tRNA-modifying protein YgfZ [Vibrio stylophorae]|uniref:tRNA-modifying protein YgfZ n=1 Tax=Vibrio stylophorae TaxID=659351 RepID=A0ABM8ZQQ3_9VIBR|nr:tRNA-modifying protein YgfZ [Vibrio stylophorae]CAH0532626.1 tRNA-modifying protein YgfZ [Vibrio stylophorae]
MTQTTPSFTITHGRLSSQDALPDCALVPLPHWALIDAFGADCKSYLQGQLTCDVTALEANQWTFAGHCDAKGKLWSIFRLFHRPQLGEQGLSLLLPKSVQAQQLAELKKYAVFSKTTLSDSSDHCFAILGSQAKATLAKVLDNMIDSALDMAEHPVLNLEQGTILMLDSTRFVICANDSQLAFWQQNLAQLPVHEPSLFDLMALQAAEPVVEQALSNQYLPQAFNLQALAGISFNKGCYIGQEMVARAKYRGANKRASYVVMGTLASPNTQLTAGDALLRPAAESWRDGATVLYSYHFTDGPCLAMAVMNQDLAPDTPLRQTAEGSDWQIQTLPYALD